ncbi:MAG: GatB/YqeY domain-containing protein [Candidatus Omnitrophica bacterium]|nr:GatB/YqeY domain-containing protein [Candidatus Omnitrophota bacterium]HOX54233.1 GatB/YqeY domain-containing protein [Candidatus Omnitrophota bacterium]
MLEDKILEDYKAAMLAKDKIKSSTLSFLRADFNNYAIDKRKKKLDDSDVIAVIKSQIKKHQDSIEQFKKGNRLELADKETKELEILKSYLPAQLSEEEVKKTISEIIASVGASGIKDMGKVMKEAMAKIGDKADNKLVSEIVREKLSSIK